MKKIVLSLLCYLLTLNVALAIDFELGGELRTRYENDNMHRIKLNKTSDVTNDQWNRDVNSGENYMRSRARLNISFFLDNNITAFFSLELQSPTKAEVFEEAKTSEIRNRDRGMGLSQGWVKVENLAGPIGIQIGRQTLSYGKERILGSQEWQEWNGVPNRWNASKIFYESDAVDADIFFAKYYSQDLNADQDENLNGIYITIKAIPATNIEAYAIHKDFIGNIDFMTYGMRVAGEAANVDWDFEYVAQSGDSTDSIMNKSLDARAWAGEIGYTIGIGNGLRIGLKSWSGSGDNDSSDDKNKTFQNLYPTNHFLYGISDVGGTSLSDRTGNGLSIDFKPVSGIKIKAEYLTVNEQASGDKVGKEINAQFWYDLTDKLQWHTYIAQFSPDDEYVGKGHKNDAYQLVGTQIQLKF